MTFTQAVRTCLLEKTVTFSGRASRSEYWWFCLSFFVVGLIIVAILGGAAAVTSGPDGTPGILFWILMIPAVVVVLWYWLAGLSALVRRFHDRNLSGWLVLVIMLLGAIPFVGVIASIASLVISILKGTEGSNRFGEDPLNPAASAEIFE